MRRQSAACCGQARLISPNGLQWPTANTHVRSSEVQQAPAATEIARGVCFSAKTCRTARQPQLPMPTTTGGFSQLSSGRSCLSVQALTQLASSALFIRPSLRHSTEFVRNTGVSRSASGGLLALNPASTSSFHKLSLVLLL